MTSLATRSHMRRPPNYWWDFHHPDDGSPMTIRVETDDPRVPSGYVEEIALPPKGYADAEIDKALRIIDDYKAGRLALSGGSDDTR